MRTSEILNQVNVLPGACTVQVYANDRGWMINLPLDAFFAEDALFADKHEGKPIPLEHGGPLLKMSGSFSGPLASRAVLPVPGCLRRANFESRFDPRALVRFGVS